MQLLSITDLCRRWCYTRTGIHKLVCSKHFPPVFTTVSAGRVKLFTEESIHAYETGKRWLFDENEKRQRQRLFLLLQMAKESPAQREHILKHCFGKSNQP